MRKQRTDREEETRDSDLHTQYDFEYVSPFDLPPGVYREGFKYHYARHNIRGATDHKLEKLLRDKWELVPRSRSKAPNIELIHDHPLAEKYIYVAGYLLLERPEIFTERQEEYLNRETIERTRSCSARINDDF